MVLVLVGSGRLVLPRFLISSSLGEGIWRDEFGLQQAAWGQCSLSGGIAVRKSCFSTRSRNFVRCGDSESSRRAACRAGQKWPERAKGNMLMCLELMARQRANAGGFFRPVGPFTSKGKGIYMKTGRVGRSPAMPRSLRRGFLKATFYLLQLKDERAEDLVQLRRAQVGYRLRLVWRGSTSRCQWLSMYHICRRICVCKHTCVIFS